MSAVQNIDMTKNLLFRRQFLTYLAPIVLTWTPEAGSAAVQESLTEPRYTPLYRIVLELDRVARQLPDFSGLRKVEATTGDFRLEGTLRETDLAAFTKGLAEDDDEDRWIAPYAVKSVPLTGGIAGFEMMGKVNQGMALPVPSPSGQPKLGATYLLRMQEYSLGQGIRFEMFGPTSIGFPNSGLDRFEFRVTSTYEAMLDWLVNVPVMSESLVERISLSRRNPLLVTVQGTVYLGDLVLDQMQSMGLREQISKTRKMAWSSKNPFSGGMADQRKREPLESAALTDLSVVGVIDQMGRKTALVKHNQPPAQLFQVRVGSYLGTQQGRVVSITSQEVVIVELVRNNDGKDIERKSVLPVQPFTAKPHTDERDGNRR